jgi:hypothetical protein
MKYINIFFLFLITSIIYSCESNVNEPKENLGDLVAIEILSNVDTLSMKITDAPKPLYLRGAFVNKTEKVLKNSGFLQSAELIVATFDTTYRDIYYFEATWISSNPQVADVERGTVKPKSPGTTKITAQKNLIVSPPLNVRVLP